MKLSASHTMWNKDLLTRYSDHLNLLSKLGESIPSVIEDIDKVTRTLEVVFTDESDYPAAKQYLTDCFKQLGVSEDEIRFDVFDIASDP